MKILFDFLTLHSKNGAAEYTRRVFEALVDRVKSDVGKHEIYCLYDSQALPKYEELAADRIECEFIHFIDIRIGIDEINNQGFDLFFFGCAQNGGWHPELSELKCRSITVFHDCVWEELYNNDIFIYLTLNNEDIFRYRETKPYGKQIYWKIKSPTLRFCRWLLHSREYGLLEKGYNMLQPSLDLFHRRDDNLIVTVSNYSKSTLIYNFNVPSDRVLVKYSPERIYSQELQADNSIQNETLRTLITEGIRYYLIVSAGRDTKNAKKALMAFKSFSKTQDDAYLVTVGFRTKLFPHHIDLQFLNDNDLRTAYQHCYALIYPSMFEGFGFPPLEAMKYGKPVLVSNVCSIPEVFGQAPIYFSPIYESAIYHALLTLNNQNYELYSKRSIEQYERIYEKQESDLQELITLIVSKP